MKEFFKKCIVAILTFEARLLLKRTKPKIIAITGSVGKTSTKDAVYTVLKNHVHTRKSEKSFNSDIGVALTVLGLSNGWNNPLAWIKNIVDGAFHVLFIKGYPKVLVLEMGVDRKGDMKRLTQWIKPDVAIITRLPDVPVHVEYFNSPEEVASEKLILVDALKQDGVFLYNNDDEKIVSYLPNVRQKAFGFSRYSQSHFSVHGDSIIYDGATPVGMECTLTHINESVQLQIMGALGVQHAYTYAAAVAAGVQFDITLQEAAVALKEHVTPQGRMRVIRGINASTIIDDTYNSSPTACEHAVQTLHEIKTKGRKIAVLGDMLELGQFSVREHERIGEFLASKVDILFTIGVRAQKIAEGALSYGMAPENIQQFDDQSALIGVLSGMLSQNDVVLVKGSQGMRTERIVKAIMAEPQQASVLLARQDTMWELR